jgi:DNA transformation protein and related proteins
VEDSFRAFVLDQLKDVGAVRCKAMFGGHGLYQGDRFFGILFKGRLYFKVSEKSKTTYIEAGAHPFKPSKTQTLKSFYEVPSEIVEAPHRMVEWAREAILADERNKDGFFG